MKRIKLTQGKYAKVNDKDWKRLRKHKWCAKKSQYNWYAVRGVWRGGKVEIHRMHRVIMNCPANKEVHHRDGDSLNNQRRNLKICTKRQNISYREGE